MKKWTLRIVIAVVALLVVVVVGAWLMIDSLAKTAVERGSEHALGVETRVDSIHVGLLRGRVGMGGLEASNPEGFDTPHLLRSGRFDLEVRPGSLLAETVEIPLLSLDGLDLNIEQRVDGSNVQRILDHLEQFKTEPKPEPGKKVRLDRVVIRNVTARFTMLPELGGERVVTVNVPEIELSDVTSDNAGGVVMGEIVARLLPPILAAVLQEARGDVPGTFLAGLSTDLADVEAALGEQGGALLRQAVSGALSGEEDATPPPGRRLEELLPGLAPREESE